MTRSLVLLTAATIAAAGCGDDTDAAAGGGGAAGAGSTSETSTASQGVTTGTTSSATTGTTSSVTTGASSSSTGGEPCDPLKNADDPSPTPGRCEGDIAVTCGQDGFLAYERCGGTTECREYELAEWRYDGLIDPPAWEPARTVDWAACLPVGAEPCPRTWNGNSPTFVDPPACDGVSKVACLGLPAPDLYANYPQLQYGGEEGWLSVVDCPVGEVCAGSDTLNVLTCIDEDTPACDGTEPRCVGDGIEYCGGTWESLPGYKVTQPCSAGLTCYEGTSGPFCREPGETACDQATYAAACTADAAQIVTCVDGWTSHQSCATCFDGNQQVPCRCDDLATASGWTWIAGAFECTETIAPSCIPQSAVDCDPNADADACIGDVAHRCRGHWEDVDCGALGLVCDVAAGRAGCRAADAPTCDPWASQSSCDGDAIVSCCSCDRIFSPYAPSQAAPCVTGYEARSDCGDLGSQYTCATPTGIWGECVYQP